LKKPMAFIAVCLFIFTVAGLAFAGSGARMKQAMEAMGAKEIAGEVTAVDAKDKMVTIKGMRSLVTATCDEKTFVKMGNVIKTCADIKVGDRANMLFESAEGRNVAKSIFLSVPAAQSPAEKQAEPEKTEPKQ